MTTLSSIQIATMSKVLFVILQLPMPCTLVAVGGGICCTACNSSASLVIVLLTCLAALWLPCCLLTPFAI